ncbi:hypothetical protein RUND412_004011 [Rhizina undulata]
MMGSYFQFSYGQKTDNNRLQQGEEFEVYSLTSENLAKYLSLDDPSRCSGDLEENKNSVPEYRGVVLLDLGSYFQSSYGHKTHLQYGEEFEVYSLTSENVAK